MSARPTRLDFHFDIMCPWAYQTSKWIRDVRERNGIEIAWKCFSLEEINRPEGKKHPWQRMVLRLVSAACRRPFAAAVHG